MQQLLLILKWLCFWAIYCQNKLNQAKVMKPVWTVLEQLPCIIPPSNFHCCLGHGKMSYGGACSHVKSNEHEGRLSDIIFLLMESESLLVAEISTF